MKLSTVARIRRELANPRAFENEEFDLYSIPSFYRGQGPEIRKGKEIGSTKAVVHPGDCLFGKLNPRVNKVWVVAEPRASRRQLATTEFLPIVSELKEDGTRWFLPKYLAYVLRTPHIYSKASINALGTTKSRERIDETDLMSLVVPIPSLAVQQEMATLLEQREIKSLEVDRLKKDSVAMTKAIIPSSINYIWRKEHLWQQESLLRLVSIVSGQVDPRVEPYSDLPHINGEAIEPESCRLLSYRTASEDEVTSKKYHFRAGSILYSKIRPYLKKAVQVPFEGVCSADVYAFDRIDSRLEPRFLMYSLVSSRFTQYANSKSKRTRIPKLNRSQLYGFELSYPPIVEQRQIVERLDDLQRKVSELIQLQVNTSLQTEGLFPAILDSSFQ